MGQLRPGETTSLRRTAALGRLYESAQEVEGVGFDAGDGMIDGSFRPVVEREVGCCSSANVRKEKAVETRNAAVSGNS